MEGAAANKETRECGDSTSAGVEMVSASFVGHLGNLLKRYKNLPTGMYGLTKIDLETHNMKSSLAKFDHSSISVSSLCKGG